jgi:hypothetical protein
VIAVPGVFARLVDDHGRQAIAHLAAQGRGHIEVAARLYPEIDLVEDGARRPAIVVTRAMVTKRRLVVSAMTRRMDGTALMRWKAETSEAMEGIVPLTGIRSSFVIVPAAKRRRPPALPALCHGRR